MFSTEDRGSITVEFALCTLVAAAIAGVLLLIVKGSAVLHALTELITRALSG
ncbi:DUF4244 domain-containing protein [Actinokineospora enzanensis]|uniref:DUF4244 domain-containing protein n=1 Tax=Actinokineospora enzanensis TaxID=155975 RepID=UPI000377D952|nr:DUF4244 domain-containing protein [Actinokineospora enzanensis]